jgi:hypothetical protein
MSDRNGYVGGLENMMVQGNVVWTKERGDEMVGVMALASTVKFLCSLYDIQWLPIGAFLYP